MKKVREYLFSLWLSLTLSILFFYPLIATLHDNIIVLQWRIQNNYELLAAIALLTTILAVLLICGDRYFNRYCKLAAYFFISVIPLISFGTHFMLQIGFKGELIALGQFATTHKEIFLVGGLIIAALSVYAGAKYPSSFLRIFVMLIVALSPLNILAGWTIWQIGDVNIRLNLKEDSGRSYQTNIAKQKKINNIIIFLFDEMSYEYLYKGREIDSRYPNIKYFSSISTNYHAATAPGNQTLTSIPGLLTGNKYNNITIEYSYIYKISERNKKEFLEIDRDNLFFAAKQKGMKTIMYGTFLPYCEMLGPSLDECRSFSIYNYGAINTSFSLFNPFLTTFTIWPHQYPQGIIKNRAASELQKEQAEEMIKLAEAALDNAEPFYLFIHFYFTHVPFTFNKRGYYHNKEPYLQDSKNYAQCLDYADKVFGDLIMRLKNNKKFDDSIIVLMSDHNYRIMFPDKRNSIPLMIKDVKQQHRLTAVPTLNFDDSVTS